jgi:TrwC relaxase
MRSHDCFSGTPCGVLPARQKWPSLESAKLTVAAFHHGEARPVEHDDGRVYADPNLHTHAVLLNCSTRADGTVGALDARHLFANKMSAGSIYHLELSSNLTKIGFEIEKVGTNGVFEIVVPQNDGQEKEKGPKVQRAAGSFFRASERGRARHGRGRSVDRGGAGADCSGRPGESIIEK